ncbi:hypothetical protein J0H58_04810 [bacterium]|nr:hypothetical protein [bacterium]
MGRLPRAASLAHEARLLLEAGDRERAVGLVREAVSAVESDYGRTDLLQLAQLLIWLDLNADAIPVLTPVVCAGVFDDATRLLLDGAIRAEDDGRA